MTTNIINDITAMIRKVDGDNRVSPPDLGQAIGRRLAAGFDIENMRTRSVAVASVVAFMARTNPDKTMGAGRLAELIVAEFNLDEEGR